MTQPSAIKGANYKIDRDISPKATKKVSKRRKRNSGCTMGLGPVLDSSTVAHSEPF